MYVYWQQLPVLLSYKEHKEDKVVPKHQDTRYKLAWAIGNGYLIQDACIPYKIPHIWKHLGRKNETPES